MIEGRSGGSWRGTGRELWAPPDSGSAHRRIAGLYRVLDSRPEPPTAPPSHFLPSAASSPSRRFVSCTDARSEPPTAPPSHFLPSAASSPVAPACWPQGKIPPHPSARSALHSSPQNGGPKGKMIERGSGGSWRGTRRELWAPPDSGSSNSRLDRKCRRLNSTHRRISYAAFCFTLHNFLP